jgi:MFS family permease
MIGRFLAGFSAGGTFTLVPLYVSEISQDVVRGSLGSFFILSCNFGMLLMYLAGNLFDFYSTPKVMIILPVVFVMLFSFFPETPFYLLKHAKNQEAQRSLKFLRGSDKREEMTDSEKCELEKMISKVEEDTLKKRGTVWRELSKKLNQNCSWS